MIIAFPKLNIRQYAALHHVNLSVPTALLLVFRCDAKLNQAEIQMTEDSL